MKFRSKVDITVLGQAEQRINKQATTRHSKRSFLCLLFLRLLRQILNITVLVP